jgi:hypothetical protein
LEAAVKTSDKKKLSAFGAKVMKTVMTEFDGFLQREKDLDLVLTAVESEAVKEIYMLLWTATYAAEMIRGANFEGIPVLLVENSEHISLSWKLPFRAPDNASKIQMIYEEHQRKIKKWREENDQFRRVQIELKYYTRGMSGGPFCTYA